jgi:hypothetical protein
VCVCVCVWPFTTQFGSACLVGDRLYLRLLYLVSSGVRVISAKWMYPGARHAGGWETEGGDESASCFGRFITGAYWIGGWTCSDVGPVERRIITWFFFLQEMNHNFTIVQTRSLFTTPTELSRYALLYLNCSARWHSMDVLQTHTDIQGLRMCLIE